MKKFPNVGYYSYVAEPFHCDFSKRLFIGHLGNHMLNAADYHSSDRGYGMHFLNSINRTWVLSRLVIEMDELPSMYDKFNVETWVDGVIRSFTSRNFKVVGADGRVFGYGKSIWAMIDTESRQPTEIQKVSNGIIMDYIETDYPCPIEKSSRIKIGETVPLVASIDTHYCDVDINGHINSVKYIEHVLDIWDVEWYRKHHVRRFEIAYIAEAHQGDQLKFYREKLANSDQKEYCVRITKCNSDGESEVCRSKILF